MSLIIKTVQAFSYKTTFYLGTGGESIPFSPLKKRVVVTLVMSNAEQNMEFSDATKPTSIKIAGALIKKCRS